LEAIRADLQQLAEVAARPAALVVGMRADWPAACELLSFRMWAHLQAPCLLCDIRKAELTDPGYCKERALDNPIHLGSIMGLPTIGVIWQRM
jgi:hypothetical protein